jgi:hypothetical protein
MNSVSEINHSSECYVLQSEAEENLPFEEGLGKIPSVVKEIFRNKELAPNNKMPSHGYPTFCSSLQPNLLAIEKIDEQVPSEPSIEEASTPSEPKENIVWLLCKIQDIYARLIHDLSQMEKDRMKEKKETALGTCRQTGEHEAKQGTISIVQGSIAFLAQLTSLSSYLHPTDRETLLFFGNNFTKAISEWVSSGYKANSAIDGSKLRILISELEQLSQNHQQTKGSKEAFRQLLDELYAILRKAYGS